MKSIVRRLRPSPAMVIACVALGVALGGTSVAAIQALPKNSVGTKQLKKNAVISSKVKNGSLLRADFKSGQIPAGPPGPPGPPGQQGQQGQQGIQGIQGPPGSALGFAYINAAGVVDANRSSNVAQANVTKPVAGFYCFNGLSFTPRSVIVTPDSTSSSSVNVFDPHATTTNLAGCPGAEQANVVMWDNASPPAFRDWGFFVLFN